MNLSMMNVLWTVLLGESFALDDARLANIMSSLEELLRGASVSSLMALLLPGLYQRLHPRFEMARDAFEKVRQLVKEVIEQRARQLHEGGFKQK